MFLVFLGQFYAQTAAGDLLELSPSGSGWRFHCTESAQHSLGKDNTKQLDNKKCIFCKKMNNETVQQCKKKVVSLLYYIHGILNGVFSSETFMEHPQDTPVMSDTSGSHLWDLHQSPERVTTDPQSAWCHGHRGAWLSPSIKHL